MAQCTYKFIIFGCIFLFSTFSGFSQEVEIEVENKSLNEVFIHLRDKYGTQFSYNDELLSKYKITVSKKFSSIDKAISFLIKDLPLIVEMKNQTYIIIEKKNKESIQHEFLLSGRIIDRNNNEVLPFTNLLINNKGLTSDFMGYWSFISSTDSVFDVKISHLGYYILDTTISTGLHHTFKLNPSVIELEEVKVKDKIIDYTSQTGEKSGDIVINHKIATFLPGNGDNSIFNLMRLQPGILAAGEQSSDLIIWGSYEGQSKVIFDGYTLFNIKNFNDNISAVNPFLAKNIQVHKGGYGVEYGQRVGGIVDITGIDGNPKRFTLKTSIDNMTLNGMMSIPLFKTSSFIIAGRKTYYNLYDADDLNFIKRNAQENRAIDYDYQPQYEFQDYNLKYSGKIGNRDAFYISFLQSGDDFSYDFIIDDTKRNINREITERNSQYCGSAFYRTTWKNGSTTHLKLNYSGLETNVLNNQFFTGRFNTTTQNRNENITNSINELSGEIKHTAILPGPYKISVNSGITKNQIFFKEDSFDIQLASNHSSVNIMHSYLNNHMQLHNNFFVDAGLRIDYPLNHHSIFLQPRISLKIKLNEKWQIHSAWGYYNQFIQQTSVIDDLGNYNYYWTATDGENIPVLHSTHSIAGLAYSFKDLILQLEGYYKNLNGITRFLGAGTRYQDVYDGEGRSYGMDIYLKKEIFRHTAWLAYTLSKTEEKFYYKKSGFKNAPHDQRHELKGAVLLNFNPYFFSLNYVYGSGFPYQPAIVNITEKDENPEYHRLDIAFTYRFNTKRFHLDAGFSVLNVFDYTNIKYDNFVRVPVNQYSSINIHSEAVPFTPIVFVNIKI